MKKITTILIILLSVSLNIKVNAKETVTLSKCVDGDTAWFYLDNKEIKVRFLAIDTPESTKEKEIFGLEASNFTCNSLKNANKIEIEYDDNSEKLDKYNRHLVWVFVNDKLLQEMLIENGLAEVKYLYGNYKYTNILLEKEQIAKEKNLNIWRLDENKAKFNYIELTYIAIFITIILILLITKKGRKILTRYIKKKIKTG